MSRASVGSSVCLSLLSLVLAAGCDLVVGDGDLTVVGNGGAVFGSATPNAVTVQPGGLLGVEDAELIGRGRVITQGMSVPPSPGAALVSRGGGVLIVGGRLAGGNVVVQSTTNGIVNPTPNSLGNFEAPSASDFSAQGVVGIPLSADPAVPPFGTMTRGPLLAPALVAQGSAVAIEGGTLISSTMFGFPEFYVQVPALVVNDSALLISGGEFRLGTVGGPLQTTRVVAASFSDVEISGGHFGDGVVLLQNSRTRITGGRFDRGLGLGNFVPLRNPQPLLVAPGCTEIRGGQFPSIAALGSAERVFIFGTNFNLPLGPVPIPPPRPLPDPLPPNVTVNPTFATVSGTLEDGTVEDFVVGFANGPAQYFLVAPGSPGCGFGPEGPIEDDEE